MSRIEAIEKPVLGYSFDGSIVKLTWEVMLSFTGEDGAAHQELVRMDAISGSLISRETNIFRALSRQIWDANSTTTWRKTSKRKEGGPPVNDTRVDELWANTQDVYDFYSQKLGRSSLWKGLVIHQNIRWGSSIDTGTFQTRSATLADTTYGKGSSIAVNISKDRFDRQHERF